MKSSGLNDLARYPEFADTLTFYRDAYPGSGVGFYSDADWARLLTAYRWVQGRTVLDVGVANGALLQVLARSGRFDRVAGIDIRQHSKLRLLDSIDYRLMSVTDMAFQDGEFDTVVCMEVLEHLESPDLEAALPQLRRVARSRLIMTVPFNEPEPLWWHDKPGGHRQKFTKDRIRRLFPTAAAAVQPRPGGVDWLFLIEDKALAPAPAALDHVLDTL